MSGLSTICAERQFSCDNPAELRKHLDEIDQLDGSEQDAMLKLSMITSTGIRHPQMQFQHVSWNVRAANLR